MLLSLGLSIDPAQKLGSRQQKTKAPLELPVHPELEAILTATSTGHLAYLVTSFGNPFTANGFGNWFRERCDEARLPHCTSHGLRKAAARRLAKAGATPREIASITGHESLLEVERYSRTANRAKLAEAATAKVVMAFSGPKRERAV